MSKYNHSGGAEVNLAYIQSIKDNYPKEFSTPKYLMFMENAINIGLKVTLYKPRQGVSKYVTVHHKDKEFKVRFSNHVPIKHLEAQQSCDFFVGVTNFAVTNTEQAWKAMMEHFGIDEDEYFT